MAGTRIVLSGSSPSLRGLVWQSSDILRIGRQHNLDVVLQDVGISKIQAEICVKGNQWVLRDLANSRTTPSYLNGVQVRNTESPLHLNDVLQFGRNKLKVAEMDKPESNGVAAEEEVPEPEAPERLKTTGSFVRVQAAANRSWDEALETIAENPDPYLQYNQHLLTLLRTGYHLTHLSVLDDLLHSILEDTIRALDAQRGAIVLADARGELHLRALLAPEVKNSKGPGYSGTLAQRCFSQGESILCQDVNAEESIVSAASVRRGAMSSIICAVLRSPRKRLGIMHLDRGPFHEPFTPYDFHLADAIAASVAVGIESALLVEQQRDDFAQSVQSLARAVEMRDQYTGDHTRRVTDYSLLLAKQLNFPQPELYQIQIGTPLHDIGKIGVSDSILRKPGELTSEEFEEMKTHTVKGAVILESIENLKPMIPIVRHHHERWDGLGYPDGLSGQEIPPTARVVAVTDAFDAMSSDRPYRGALSVDEAFREIYVGSGSHFAPEYAEAFLDLRPQIEELFHADRERSHTP